MILTVIITKYNDELMKSEKICNDGPMNQKQYVMMVQ